MSDLLVEIDEMMRQERIVKFWKRYGNFVIAFVTITILGTALTSGYNSWNEHIKTGQTDKLIEFIDSADFPENINFETLKLKGGVKAIALLSAANMYLEDDKKLEALEIYEQTLNDKSLPEDLRQLADIMALRLQDNDGKQNDVVVARLQEIANNHKSPWRYHAKLDLAVWNAHQEQNYDEALAILNTISSRAEVPKSLWDRARTLEQIYETRKYQMKDNQED